MASIKITKNLSDLLKKIGSEVHTTTTGGDVYTKDESLIRLLWDTALGYEERSRDDHGKEKVVKHKAQRWAMELIYNRREGGVIGALPDDSGQLTVVDQVRGLATARLNKLAAEKKYAK